MSIDEWGNECLSDAEARERLVILPCDVTFEIPKQNMTTVNCRTSYLMAVKKLLTSMSVCVEIGVYRGDFSAMILDVLEPSKLVLIDPFVTQGKRYGEDMGYMHVSYSSDQDYNNVLQRFSKEIKSGKVVVDRNFSYGALENYDDNSFDFIYIDGSHLYEDVKRDLNDWLPKLKDNSIIAGHDYISQPSFGVIQAVNEFCKEKGFEMILLNSEGGDFALKRIV